MLSILAALGAVTFVFQEGHLAGVFGIARPGPILSFLPIILLGILFGLAMDYEVFLESRMREESRHKDATTAVTDGYTGSAKVVGSAAIIMTSVFASFILSPDPTTKSLGFALALGVLIDAFVIRMTVVPATMYIFKGDGLVAAALDAARPARPRHRGGQARRASTAARLSSATPSGGRPASALLPAGNYAMPPRIWKTTRMGLAAELRNALGTVRSQLKI